MSVVLGAKWGPDGVLSGGCGCSRLTSVSSTKLDNSCQAVEAS